MDAQRIYGAALDLTQRMATAAAVDDWQAVAELEQQRAALIGDLAATRNAIPAEQRLPIADLIRRIEVLGATILERATVRRSHIGILMRDTNAQPPTSDQ